MTRRGRLFLRFRERIANGNDAKLPIIEFDDNIAALLKPDRLAELGWHTQSPRFRNAAKFEDILYEKRDGITTITIGRLAEYSSSLGERLSVAWR